jgi:hypothetical protein
MSNSSWQTLLKSALETEDYEIDCQECYELLDLYAEIILSEGNPDDIMGMVSQHLKQCNCCSYEFEALMIMIQQAAEKEQAAASETDQ